MNRRHFFHSLALLTTAPILLPERRGFVGWSKSLERAWYPERAGVLQLFALSENAMNPKFRCRPMTFMGHSEQHGALWSVRMTGDDERYCMERWGGMAQIDFSNPGCVHAAVLYPSG